MGLVVAQYMMCSKNSYGAPQGRAEEGGHLLNEGSAQMDKMAFHSHCGIYRESTPYCLTAYSPATRGIYCEATPYRFLADSRVTKGLIQKGIRRFTQLNKSFMFIIYVLRIANRGVGELLEYVNDQSEVQILICMLTFLQS